MPTLEKRLCFGAYRLNRAFNRFYQRAFCETGLTYPKYVILSALEEQGAMSVSELSQHAGVEPNSLSPLLKKMSGFGVLSRERLAEDERRVVIDLTERGRELLRQVHDVIARGFADLGLDEAHAHALLEGFEDMRNRLDQANPPRLSLE